LGQQLGLQVGALPGEDQPLARGPESRLLSLLANRLKLGNPGIDTRQRRHHGHIVNVGNVRNVVDRGIVDRVVCDILHHGVLLNQGSRRPSKCPAKPSGIQIPQTMFPRRIRPIGRPVVAVKRIVAAAAEAEGEPANESPPSVAGIKVIAEIIVIALRVHEQRAQEAIVVHHITRLVKPMRPECQVKVDSHWREQQPTLSKRVIPVALYI
jgi:hypothetical protein